MFIHIDPHDGLAIYDQVVRQIKFAVAAGVLKTGELVPSVRELARQLTINPNTVTRAYRQLQDERVLDVVRGTGLAVTPRAAEQCRKQRLDMVRLRLRQVFMEAQRGGLSTSELQQLSQEELERASSRTKRSSS